MINNESHKMVLNEDQIILAKDLKISEDFLRLLLSRGHKAADLHSFLYPSIDEMCSPFDIKNVDVACERIKLAIKNKEKILIFGDYDCDGICAISILMLYLRDKADVFYFIPNRNKDGYGMTIEALSAIIKSNRPSLVITVDCGITSEAEVDYLSTQHIDCIITDHHEPQATMPNCIVVDPKIERKGFYDFCGAGVALKLVEALAGRSEAMKYMDIAAIATIADVVPLEKDNRIIASFGLKALTTSPRKGVTMLLGKDMVLSQDVMFKLAPRMNAAGRLNSAMKVVDLFLENDFFMLKSLAEELARDNALRQEICESVVADAKGMLRGINFDTTRMIILSNDGWEIGVLGIAAARLAEEFKCPVLLLAKIDDVLKGSARSIASVNVFELFTQFSEYFINFGGHSQAAGVTMKEDSVNEFQTAVNLELQKNHADDEFLPKVACEMELDISRDVIGFVKELEMLEPTGCCNPKPHFLIKGDNLQFEKIGFTPHIKCSIKNLDILGFRKFENCIDAFRSRVELQVTLGLNIFQNVVKAQAIINSLEILDIKIDETASKLLSLHHLDHKESAELPKIRYTIVENAELSKNTHNLEENANLLKMSCDIDGNAELSKNNYNIEENAELPKISKEDIKCLLKKPFGNLIVCFSQEEYDNLVEGIEEIKRLPLFVGDSNFLNPQNCVVLSPSQTFEYAFYQKVIIAGKPMTQAYLDIIKNSSLKCFVIGDVSPCPLQICEDKIREVFRALRTISVSNQRMASEKKLYQCVREKVAINQVEFCAIVKMFKELQLLSVSDRGMISISNNKTELIKSTVFRNTR